MMSTIGKEDLLLSVYISDVLNNVLTELATDTQQLHKESTVGKRKVSFSSALVKIKILEDEEEDDSFGAFDETIPLEEEDSTDCTCYSSLTFNDNCHDQVVPEIVQELHSDAVVASNICLLAASFIGSYTDFKRGLRKHSHTVCSEPVDDNESPLFAGPLAKKSKLYEFKDDDNDDNCPLIASTPEDPTLIDMLYYISYHVQSYALSRYTAMITTSKKKEVLRPKKIKHGLHEMKRRDFLNPDENHGYAITLAKQIINQNSDNSVVVKNVMGEKDFSSHKEYDQFLRKNDYKPEKHLKLTFTDELREERRILSSHNENDIRTFFMPEFEDPSIESSTSYFGQLCPYQLPVVTGASIIQAKLENIQVSPVKTSFSDNYDAYKPFSLDIRTDGTSLNTWELPVSDEIYGNENSEKRKWADDNKQTCSMKKQRRKLSVDDMIMELMLTQAAHSDSQDEDEETFSCETPTLPPLRTTSKPCKVVAKKQLIFDPLCDVSVVPDLNELIEESSTDLTQHEQQHNNTTACSKDSQNYVGGKRAFTWCNSTFDDDAVVPFSHEPFFRKEVQEDHFKTPQKLRLGLSKRLKPKEMLHPYRKTK